MALLDLLSELDKLSRSEKLRVIQHLAHDLETEEIDVGASWLLPFLKEHAPPAYEVWSPQDEGGAVATLHKLLQEHQQNQARDAE